MSDIKISEATTLTNPQMKIKTVVYDVDSNSYELVILFREGEGRFHWSRSYSFQNDEGESLSMPQIIENIKEHELLKQIPIIK